MGTHSYAYLIEAARLVTNIEAAITSALFDISDHSARHENGGDDVLSLAGLAVAIGDITGHDKAAHDALDITPATHTIDKHTDVLRHRFIPATSGYTDGQVDVYGSWSVVRLDSATDETITVSFRVPSDYASGGTIKFLYIGVSCPVGDTIVWDMSLAHGVDGEAYNSNASSDTGNLLTNPEDNTIREVTTSLAFSSLSKGDYVGLYLKRDADHGSDDCINDFFVVGFIFEYTAEQ